MHYFRGRQSGLYYVPHCDAAIRLLLPHDPFGNSIRSIQLTFGPEGTQDQLDELRHSLEREFATVH